MTPERVREIESWKQEKLGLPHITLKWAQSLDGQLADNDDCSQWISGPEERQYTHWLRSVHEAVLVGAQTFLKDRCQLTVRSIPFAGQQPVRVVADPRGRIYEALEKFPDLFSSDPSLKMRRTYVLVKELKNISQPQAKDVVYIECKEEGSLDAWLLTAIAKLATEFRLRELRPLYGLMVEGGSAILTALLRSEAADTV
jgi:riboflavin-specific deaminase-like protein